MVSRLSKAETLKALEELPDAAILGADVSRELTPRQKRFAREVAKGKSKAQAYRESYGADKAPRTITTRPYILMQDERVKREIEALELAERAAAYRTPAKLREFVIQTLLEVALDPETKAAVRVQAVKTLGTVTEVAAFTEQKVVTTISSSSAARQAVLEELKNLLQSADDVQDVEAKTLLDELQDPSTSGNIHYRNPESGNVTTQSDNDVSTTGQDQQDT